MYFGLSERVSRSKRGEKSWTERERASRSERAKSAKERERMNENYIRFYVPADDTELKSSFHHLLQKVQHTCQNVKWLGTGKWRSFSQAQKLPIFSGYLIGFKCH